MARKAVSVPETPAVKNGRYDSAKRRKAQRHGREKGCRVNIPQEVLLLAGYDPNGPAPYYRVWGDARGRIVIQLYREQ